MTNDVRISIAMTIKTVREQALARLQQAQVLVEEAKAIGAQIEADDAGWPCAEVEKANGYAIKLAMQRIEGTDAGIARLRAGDTSQCCKKGCPLPAAHLGLDESKNEWEEVCDAHVVGSFYLADKPIDPTSANDDPEEGSEPIGAYTASTSEEAESEEADLVFFGPLAATNTQQDAINFHLQAHEYARA